jgi:RimJ/RimL family protein N-acetyltransferase
VTSAPHPPAEPDLPGPGPAGLVAVPPSGVLREAALRLAPHPEQEEFSGRADQTLPLAERDPARHPYVLVEDGTAVAFLVLDQTPTDADPTADLLLRGFLVDAAAQGRGVATRAVAALPDVVRRDFPSARSVVLTVNVRNPVARSVYVRGGFVDAGELYLGGSAGPQHVLRLELGASGGSA